MRGIATFAAAIMFLSNCANIPYAYSDYDESYRRTVNDNAYNQYACRFQNHDFRYCR